MTSPCASTCWARCRSRSARTVAERRQRGRRHGETIELSLIFLGGVRAELRFGNLMPKRRWFAAHLERAVLVYDDLAPAKLDPPRADAGAHRTRGRGFRS